MNRRMTLAAAAAVILASTAETVLIRGAGWLAAVIGAVAVVAVAGSLTRLAPVPAAASGTTVAMIACAPLLAIRHWYGPVIAAAVAAGCAARAAARPRALHAFAYLATPLAGLLLYLNAVYAARESLARVVPTISSLRHLGSLASQAQQQLKYAPPIPGASGVQLITAAAVGVVAIAVDLVAVRLRRPAIAGLGLLALFLAPIATKASDRGVASVIAFCLGGTGFLAMLAADGRYRFRAFGHVVSVWHGIGEDDRLGGPDVKALAASGRRIGLAAVCLAVAAPLVLPSLHALRHGGQGNGTVPSPVSLPAPVAQMRDLLDQSRAQTVLTYTTDAGNAAAQYLQVYVLNYDPATATWQLVRPGTAIAVSGNALTAPPGLTAAGRSRAVHTSVTLGKVAGYSSRLTFLPLPYPPTRLTVPGSWSEDAATLMVYSGQDSIAGLSYHVLSAEPDPTDQLLNGTQQPTQAGRQYLGFASPVRARLLAIAERVTRGQRSPFAKAEALQRWFLSGGGFSYSLKTGLPNTPQGLLKFLQGTRRGFCQQFAFAMAALARLLGIPARVAVGFTGGTRLHDSTWQVTTADAHAWPELFFHDVGWLRFEPTPGGAQGQGTAVPPPYAAGPASGGGPGGTNTKFTPPATKTPAGGFHPPGRLRVIPPGGGAAPGHGGLAAPGHGSGGRPLGLAAAVLLVLAAAAPGIARLAVRMRRWRGASDDAGLAQAAWLEIRDELANLGLACRASESPRAVARRVAATPGVAEPARQAMSRIASAVEQAQYAPAPPAVGSIRSDVALVRRGLARSVRLRSRCRAVLLPESTLQPAMAALQRWLDLSGRLDAGSRLRVQAPNPS